MKPFLRFNTKVTLSFSLLRASGAPPTTSTATKKLSLKLAVLHQEFCYLFFKAKHFNTIFLLAAHCTGLIPVATPPGLASTDSMPRRVAATQPAPRLSSRLPGIQNWPSSVHSRGSRPGNVSGKPPPSVPKQQKAPEHKTPATSIEIQ